MSRPIAQEGMEMDRFGFVIIDAERAPYRINLIMADGGRVTAYGCRNRRMAEIDFAREQRRFARGEFRESTVGIELLAKSGDVIRREMKGV
jgi:hypothetical protein